MSSNNERGTDNQNALDSQRKMVEGSTWMTFGSIGSKLLGALYIIPWMAWMGSQETAGAANALFQVGYTPYSYFLALATAGIPSAISQQVSHYNAIGEFETSKNIYKRALQIMGITGLVAGLLMYVLAPAFSAASPNADVNDGITVIRSLVPALLIIPIMSVTRGFLQGHNTMKPSAVSQVIEQLARVVFMLASVYLIRQVMNGEVLTAVSLSTFAAFVGALFSLIYLIYNVRRGDNALTKKPEESLNAVNVSTNELIKSIIITAIPFIVLSTALTVSQFIDQFTYSPIMEATSNLSLEDIQLTYGVSHANANKLVMILVSFGSAMATTSIPLISEMVARQDFKSVRKQFTSSFQLLLFIMIPASAGLALLAEPFYTVFYGFSEFGTSVTRVSAIIAFLWSLYALLTNFAKSVNIVKPMIWTLVLGLLLKLLMQYPFVSQFGVYGMLITTIIAFAAIVVTLAVFIHRKIDLNWNFIGRRMLLIILMTVAMAMVVFLVNTIFGQFVSADNRLMAVVRMGVSALAGVAVYGYLALKTRLADKLLGDNIAKIRNMLRIK